MNTPINIHQLRGDESGFVASNREKIRGQYWEGYGNTEDEAKEELAEIIAVDVQDMEVLFRG
jgi:hypothetical protein